MWVSRFIHELRARAVRREDASGRRRIVIKVYILIDRGGLFVVGKIARFMGGFSGSERSMTKLVV